MALNQKLNLVLAMQVFARVVEAGTFTKAADSLQMPKATVTKLVQSLESHLHVRLLNRTTRRVAVTPDGSAYYERAVRLLEDLADLESSVSMRSRARRGPCASTSVAHLRACYSSQGWHLSRSATPKLR